MEYIGTTFRHRLYLVSEPDGYPEGTVLVFREGLFRRLYKPGMECASVSSVEQAEAVAKALFCGMRLEDLDVQMRDARLESEQREGSRDSVAAGGASNGD